MDVIQSGGRDDTTVLAPPSLIELSNDGFDVRTPIFRVPTEITEITDLIFRQFRSRFVPPITLTHVCRRWRNIAVNDASLWTYVWIQTRYKGRNDRLDNLLSFLSMQLDRTANLLLDVIWEADVGDGFYVETLQLLRQKALFSRWRTLRLHISHKSQGDLPWPTEEVFTNLESLCVQHWTESSIMSAIDRTTTSRLKILDLETWPSDELKMLMTSFAKSLTHISTIRLASHVSYPFPPVLDNVANLGLGRGGGHIFPNLRTYEVGIFTFYKFPRVDLENVTTLITTDVMTLARECHVILPALRELKLGTLLMRAGATIETPSLDSMHFMGCRRYGTEAHKLASTCLQVSLLAPGYLLSPNTSVIVDCILPTTTVIALLSKSPKVTVATLRFEDWADAQVVLDRLLGFKMDTDSRSPENEILCPRLSELRLDFDWELSEPSVSKEWLVDALTVRRKSGSVTPPSLYAGWKGEGTYVLLTSS